MSKGIYGYYDKENDYICVYIGKDSSINKNRRHKQHLQPSNYDAQTFNRVLQNNPDRYEYRVICEYPDLTEDELNWLECMEIMKHKFLYGERPKFSFTVGSDGTTGYRKSYEDFEYTVTKAGFSGGKQQYCINNRDDKPIKNSINKEALDEIAVALNNGKITEEEAKVICIKKTFKYTVTKAGFSGGKRQYTICGKNHQQIKTSINKEALEEIAVSLNNGEITEKEAKAIDLNPFEYSVAKAGFNKKGKQQYSVCDRDHKQIKRSIDKDFIIDLVKKLNNGEITEEEVKAFKYTVVKMGFVNGKQNYTIYGRNNNSIKQSINKEALDKIADALNNSFLTEEEVKNNRGVDFIWV